MYVQNLFFSAQNKSQVGLSNLHHPDCQRLILRGFNCLVANQEGLGASPYMDLNSQKVAQ